MGIAEDIHWGSQTKSNKSGDISESIHERFNNSVDISEHINFNKNISGFSMMEENIPEDSIPEYISGKSEYGWSGIVSQKSRSLEKKKKTDTKVIIAHKESMAHDKSSYRIKESINPIRKSDDLYGKTNVFDKSSKAIEKSMRSIKKNFNVEKDFSAEKSQSIKIEDLMLAESKDDDFNQIMIRAKEKLRDNNIYTNDITDLENKLNSLKKNI